MTFGSCDHHVRCRRSWQRWKPCKIRRLAVTMGADGVIRQTDGKNDAMVRNQLLREKLQARAGCKSLATSLLFQSVYWNGKANQIPLQDLDDLTQGLQPHMRS